MKKQKLLLFAMLIVFTAIFVSCKKSNKSSVQCSITEVKANNSADSEDIKLEYDTDKRLSSLFYAGSSTKRTLVYEGKFIIQTVVSASGSVNEVDTIATDADGLVSTEVWHFMSGSNAVIEYDTMTYDANKQLIKIVQLIAGVKQITNYTWDNGDLSSASGDTYTYYPDKKASDGDFVWTTEVLRQGIRQINCKHLCKNSGIFSVAYTFDKDEKITSTTITDPSSARKYQYNYTYTCN